MADTLFPIPADVLERARRVKLMIFDVDGVLSDGSLHFSAGGDTLKTFNSLDGHGIKLLGEAGIPCAIITGRRSDIVKVRSGEMRIAHLYQGVENKLEAFADLLKTTGLTAADCGYMGDDWPDLPVMLKAGFAAAPANAHVEVRRRAHWVSDVWGGEGAVREACDLILRAQDRYDALLAAACGA